MQPYTFTYVLGGGGRVLRQLMEDEKVAISDWLMCVCCEVEQVRVREFMGCRR